MSTERARYEAPTARSTTIANISKTDGSPEQKLPPITVASGAHIVLQFGLTGAHPHAVLGLYPDRPAVNADQPGRFVREVFLLDGKEIRQLTAFNRFDTSTGGEGGRGVLIGDRVVFLATADFGENPHAICQLFSISTLGDHLRQLTHLPWDGRPSPLGCISVPPGCGIFTLSTTGDQVTGTVLFSSSCDPVGANPFGEQIFAMRPNGTGLRQLTNARGMTTDPGKSPTPRTPS